MIEGEKEAKKSLFDIFLSIESTEIDSPNSGVSLISFYFTSTCGFVVFASSSVLFKQLLPA